MPPACSPGFAQTVRLKGAAGQTASQLAADLAALPRVKFSFDAHGATHDYEGALLADLLAEVAAPAGKALSAKGGPCKLVVEGDLRPVQHIGTKSPDLTPMA